MNLKAKVERDEKVPIKKVNNRTHFFERVHKTEEVRPQKSTKSIKHQKSSKSNEVKPTKKFKNAKELINLKEVKNTKEVKTHILVFLQPVVNPKQGGKETNAGVGDRKVLVALEGGRLCVSPSTAARPLLL